MNVIKIREVYLKVPIDHIGWMMTDAMHVCKQEKLDDSLLLPLVILHDVGYSRVLKEYHFQLTDIKKLHMEEGKNIAIEVLNSIRYSESKIEKIAYYISVHDNWALGEDEVFKKDIILGVFTDLDFIWMATKKGFLGLQEIWEKSPTEMLELIEQNDKLTKRPLCTKTTRSLYEKYTNQRRKEIAKVNKETATGNPLSL